MPSKSTRNYRKNPESKAKKDAYNRKYYRENKEDLNESRAERSTYRRKAEKKGVNVKGKDVSHTKNGLRLKKSSTNRGSKSDAAGDRRARGKK